MSDALKEPPVVQQRAPSSASSELDRTYRVDPLNAPQRVEIALSPSPYATASTAGPVLKWMGFIGLFMALSVAVGDRVRGDAKIVFPITFIVLAAAFVATQMRAKRGETLVLIERTLHRVDAKGAIIESIADLRGEVTLAVWSFSAGRPMQPYYGKALALRFASGPLYVSLFPTPMREEGPTCAAPSWMIEPAHFAMLVELGRST